MHYSFAAMQDVAIDALAVNTLHEDERGLADGRMFGGAAIGVLVGGSGVLFLTPYVGFQATFSSSPRPSWRSPWSSCCR